jgi:DNA topoisomerase-1
MTTLLIVESPSKGKTLSKYLGPDYEVLASYGHVRDLRRKDGAVDPTHGFAMSYELIDRNKRHVDAILKAAAGADNVLLATDPDREGEAIAWHLAEILHGNKATAAKPLKRVVFHEVTKSAVQHAVENPRDISTSLVNAQQARRALDHLVGFNLSPVLWRKIKPGLSAGRVQSPALRLIVEREEEIERFQSREYWSLHLDSNKSGQSFSAKLAKWQGTKVEQFSFTTEAEQAAVVAALQGQNAKVISVEKSAKTRRAAAPFTTSTLQQEAVRKLGMTTERTMRTAQTLYEGVDVGEGTVGLITYMRTDSVTLAREAIADIRAYIEREFDSTPHDKGRYLPERPNAYSNAAANAQEAHEAIRPTSISRTPESVRQFLSPEQFRLYEMIWKRTLASQMSPAQYDTVAADIAVGEGVFRATGQTLVFPGFMKVYLESEDDKAEEGESRLPALVEGDALPVDRVYGEQHFTQPPPRYTEASLVKALEEFGIGRPSTYASIVKTLQDREYVVLDKKRFTPTGIGRLVCGFLVHYARQYVDYDFTAKLEAELDGISKGEVDWIPVMERFWSGFHGTVEGLADVLPGIPLPEPCPKCGKAVHLRASSRGLFCGCTGYPDCDYTKPWGRDENEPGNRALGEDPDSGLQVYLCKGPYGHYVQLGETPAPPPKDAKGKDTVEKGNRAEIPKPKRASWPKEKPLEEATLDDAVYLLSLPRVIGLHPDGKPIELGSGKFGPYVKHNGVFKSLAKTDSIFGIELARALELLATEKSGAVGKILGMHPKDGRPITAGSGKFGPYVKWGDVYASIPKDEDPEAVDLDMAIDLIAAKVAKQLGDKTGGIVVDPAKMPAGKARQRSAPRERMEVDGNHVDGPRMVRAGSGGGGGKPGGGKPGGGGGGAGRGGRGRGGQRGSGGGGQRKGGGNA